MLLYMCLAVVFNIEAPKGGIVLLPYLTAKEPIAVVQT